MPTWINKLARGVMRCYPFPRGQGRIIDRTALGRMRFSESILEVPTTDGFAIKVFPNDLIGRQLYLTGQFDRTIVEVLVNHSRPGDCILDIGANIGYVSCALVAAVADSQLVAVEPQENCFELLRDNLARLSGGRGKALKLAVSDRCGMASLELRSGNFGATRIGAVDSNGGVQVVTGTVLMEMTGLPRLDLVKIDVEGHEDAVITSLAPVIEQYRPRAIVFEHFGGFADASNNIRKTLEQLKYSIWGVKKNLLSWRLISLAQMLETEWWASDYVALPEGASH